MSTITFVTGNANKLREVRAILCGGNDDAVVGKWNITNQAVDLDEVQGSVEEVTRHKAAQAAKLIGGPVLVEDTCLCFEALGGLPGPYIKWFVKSVGLEGINKMLDGFDNRNAHAITTFGFSLGPDSEVLLFQGVTDGTIVLQRGHTGFGWDAIFQPVGFENTYAEMDGAAKNRISQRSKALAKVKEYLERV